MTRLSMTREQRRPVNDTGRLSYCQWPPERWAWSTGGRAWVHTGTAHTGTSCPVLDTTSHKDIVTGTPADSGHKTRRRHKSVLCELMETNVVFCLET